MARLSKPLVAPRAQPEPGLDAVLVGARQAEARAQQEVGELRAASPAFSAEPSERKLAKAETLRRNIEAARVRLTGEIGGLAEARSLNFLSTTKDLTLQGPGSLSRRGLMSF